MEIPAVDWPVLSDLADQRILPDNFPSTSSSASLYELRNTGAHMINPSGDFVAAETTNFLFRHDPDETLGYNVLEQSPTSVATEHTLGYFGTQQGDNSIQHMPFLLPSDENNSVVAATAMNPEAVHNDLYGGDSVNVSDSTHFLSQHPRAMSALAHGGFDRIALSNCEGADELEATTYCEPGQTVPNTDLFVQYVNTLPSDYEQHETNPSPKRRKLECEREEPEEGSNLEESGKSKETVKVEVMGKSVAESFNKLPKKFSVIRKRQKNVTSTKSEREKLEARHKEKNRNTEIVQEFDILQSLLPLKVHPVTKTPLSQILTLDLALKYMKYMDKVLQTSGDPL